MASPVELLRSAPVFRELSEADRRSLSEVGQVRLYRKGDTIFHEGDAAEVLYTVLRGKVKVFKTTATGKDLTLALLGPGAPVGAVAVYHSCPFPASARAFEESVLISIPSADFFDVLSRDPGFLRRFLGAMTHRLMEFNHRFPELAGGNVEARFARFFLKLSSEIGEPGEAGMRIPLALSRQELSDFTGTTIETAIRIMSRWNKEGIVVTTEGGFVLENLDALTTLSAT